RRFGGVGLMVESPGVVVSASTGQDWSAEGPLAGRALDFAGRFVRSLEADFPGRAFPPQRLAGEQAAPEHAGLGTGTQLGLAVGAALAAAYGLELSPDELARRVGRGRRSALGVHGFARGGFLVEAGQGAADALAPLVARVDFPEGWRVLVVLP